MKERCAALNADGDRCRRRSEGHVRYHGDPELNNTANGRPQWVVVPMCPLHFKTFLRLNQVEPALRTDGSDG